jgi:hypothetical protein
MDLPGRGAIVPQPTRIADDLTAAAKVEGAKEGRSTAEQINHWARVGRAVSDHAVVSRRRVEAALAGVFDLDELNAPEAVVFDAEVEARLDERIAGVHLGERLAARGITTVELDDTGELIETRPDGTRRRVGAP